MKFEDIKVGMNVTDEIDSKIGCGRVVSKDCQHKIVTVKFNGNDIVYFNSLHFFEKVVLEMALSVLLLVKAEKYCWNRQIPLPAVAI